MSSIFDESVAESIRAYVQARGGEVWGRPIPVGDRWRATVAITPAGPLVVAEFKVSLGKFITEQEEPNLAQNKTKAMGDTP